MDFAQLPDAKECMVLVKFELWNLINATSCERRNFIVWMFLQMTKAKAKTELTFFHLNLN